MLPLFNHDKPITNNRVLYPMKELIPGDPIITLDQAKSWLKMDGITADNENIQSIIDAGIEWIERICAISIQAYTVTATVEIHNRIELPYGPVTEIISINDVPFADVKGCRIIGPSIGFPRLAGYGLFIVVYKTGYNPIPPGIFLALKEYISWCYEHRGDNYDENDSDFCLVAKRQLSTFRRNIGV